MSKKRFISTGKLPSNLSDNPWLMKVLYTSNPYIPFLVFIPLILGFSYYSFAILQLALISFFCCRNVLLDIFRVFDAPFCISFSNKK